MSIIADLFSPAVLGLPDALGLCLIAATSPLEWLLVILQVSLGLGAVIFVHELGHFAVAKMCGVKCDKFFIGFDVGGYKISRKWGETEYGIGILPLGGYVKMLGQDDNPANIAEQVRESEVSGKSKLATKEITGPDGEKFVVDSRSYLAKSVPQRMAIISAGVIMNVIFAVIFATFAFRLGVPIIPSIVSQVAPGSAAYQAGIRTGDEITAIGDVKNPSFMQLKSSVTLGDLENGIPFTILRAETGKEEVVTLRPQQETGLAKVGIFSPSSLRMSKEKAVGEDTPAANASTKFESGDEVIAVGVSGEESQPITTFREWTAFLVQHTDQPLEVTVRRGGTAPQDDRFGRREGGEEVTITVPTRPMQRLGLAMEMGKIAAVQQHSPAADAGLQSGDFIDKIGFADDSTANPALTENKFRDPIALPEQLRRMAEDNRTIRLSVRRSASSSDGRQANEEIDLPLRKVTWIEPSWVEGDPLSVPALGLAYRVLNRVRDVQPASPAAKAGLQAGDVITKAEFILPKDEKAELEPTEFGKPGKQNWPTFVEQLQRLPASAEIKITYKRGDETATATLTPAPVSDQFVVPRGFIFEPIQRIKIASTFGEQFQLGFEETKNSLSMVFRFLRKLGTQVPFTALGGPVTIAKAAGYSAFEGPGKLLLFLTMLSANLAVINFMPIPMLDGGHMVFLAWEGIRGRPASEKFVIALHTVGFVCIISLMVFVLGLDLNIIPRNM